ncbi:MAG TPA: glucose-6-phosphate dehydrogenase [Tepidisphaeraceae bacterium]|nr:glucose-6-phosphate dehydrogenase [Tepidisphaeraceae bacterium]
MPTAPSCAIVIFGASGDLAKRKLIPAIYELAKEKLLHESSYVVGYSRSEMSDEQFRRVAREAVEKHARSKPIDEEVWKKLEPRFYYTRADYGSPEDHSRVAATLGRLDKKFGNGGETGGSRLFYLATPPETFDEIITRLGERELIEKGQNHDPSIWHRIIIEKPFGRDLASAQQLNQLLHKEFTEEQVFRIDHYLGKETVQNLMVMRFANTIFEPIWNHKYIDHVQITVSESLGVGTRGGYYDQSGALRDMVQNHIFQLMALVAMEPPVALDATSIRDEKVKVFRAVRPTRAGAVDDMTVRGQYATGEANRQKTGGYRSERDVPKDSQTETFAALKLFIDNWRWSGTPFYLRTGKFLPEKLSEIVVRFQSPPLTLFQKQCESPVYPNDLIIRVQPEEGISWRMNGKVPGGQLNIKPVALDFFYKTTFNVEPPEAYERLIFDAITGDQTLFIRGDEAEAAWAVIDPIEQAWASSKHPPQEYAPGSWGPKRAMELIERDGRRWLHGSKDGEPEPIIACTL